MSDTVEVTQADREAIAMVTENQPASEEEAAGQFSRVAEQFRNGELDEHPLVQAFARHRRDATAAALQETGHE